VPLVSEGSGRGVSRAIDSACESRIGYGQEKQSGARLRKLGESTKQKSECEGGQEGNRAGKSERSSCALGRHEASGSAKSEFFDTRFQRRGFESQPRRSAVLTPDSPACIVKHLQDVRTLDFAQA
jgi:hypothetical protein